MGDEQMYTLAEARREIRRAQCMEYGHSWDVISNLSGPTAIICPCGESYRVVRASREGDNA